MPSFSTAERISLTASLTLWVTPSSCGCALFRYSTSTSSLEVPLLPSCKVFCPLSPRATRRGDQTASVGGTVEVGRRRESDRLDELRCSTALASTDAVGFCDM